MSHHPSRTFRLWCAGLIVLVFSSSSPGAAWAKVAPIDLVKFQLRKPNFLIVVESAESMQGLPGENAARYNEVGADCENGDRFCRLYGQAGRCEFSGMGKQGYVFDEVPVYSGTSVSTDTRTGGTKIITQTETGSITKFTTAVATSTGANSSGATVTSSTTGTTISVGTQTAYQTGTSTNSESYYQTATQSALSTSYATGTFTGSETYTATSTVTGTQTQSATSTATGTRTRSETSTGTETRTYSSTVTQTGTQTYTATATKTGTETFNSSKIAFDNATTSTTWGNNNWSFSHTLGSGSNRMLVIFTAAGGGSALSHTNVKYNGTGASFLGSVDFNVWGVFGKLDAWVIKQSSLPAGGSYNVTGTSPTNPSIAWMMAISFSGVDQSTPGWATAVDNSTTGKTISVSRTAGVNDWLLEATLVWENSTASTIAPGSEQALWLSQGNTTSWYMGCSTKGPLSGASSVSWNQTLAWNMAGSLLIDLAPAITIANRTATMTKTTTDSRSVTNTGTGTFTNTGSRTLTSTGTETMTNTASRTLTATNTGTITNTASRTVTTHTATTTNVASQSVTSNTTATNTNTSSRVSTANSSGSTTNIASATATVSQTATLSQTELASAVVLTSAVVTTNTDSYIGTMTNTATVTATYIAQPVPDTEDCNVYTSCGGASTCYLQSKKVCSSNSDCTIHGDFCRRVSLNDGTNRIRGDSCIVSNPANSICRYQAKSCIGDAACNASTVGLDYCVNGASAQMCQKTGLWCSVADTGVTCSGSDDKCGPATSRMMMVKNAVRRVFLDHAYDDSAVVKIGQMHTYQANRQGSTENLFPYVKLAEPTLDRSEIKFLSRSELLRGTYNSSACFSESTGPSGTCVIDYGGGGASTTPSVTYTLVTDVDKNDSRYGIPTGDGKTLAHVDGKWGTCGLSCSFPSASTAGKGLYEGSYYRFTYRSGVPIDAGGDPNNPVLGSLKNPQYYSTYRGKSFGTVNNYWMLMDAERSDIVNENKYGALGFSGASWNRDAEYGLPFRGASGDPLSTSVDCSSSNGAQWDHNLVPMVNATSFASHSVSPTEKALLNVARLEKNSFGGFHAVGNIAPVACALKNDGSNDDQHSVEAYMNEVKTSDAGACWGNHVLLVVDGLPRGPGDVAIGGIDCSATACNYETNPTLSGCSCPAVTKARSLAASGINVHVIAATTNPVAVNPYAAMTLNNIALAGSAAAGFYNQPRYAASEDELTFWLNYEMKEGLRVRVATTPASAASGSQSLSGVTAGNMLFQTVADLPEWRGSVLGYEITSSVGTSTSTSVGTSTSVTYSTGKKWDAAKANGWVPCIWSATNDPYCTEPDDVGWKKRSVFFSDNAGVVHKIGVSLDTGSVDGDSKSALLALGMGANANETERIVQWMLGKIDGSDTSLPRRPLNPAVMGSVVNSMPIHVGAPGVSLQLGGRHFYYTHVTRPELVYVGADDGMLHAFYAGNGKEAFAFIPADMVPVIARLYAQGGQRYNPSEHIYGLSGSPKVKNLCVANCNPTTPDLCSDEEGGSYNAGACPVWKTILIMGEGQGGHHPFALDVTDPIVGSAADLEDSLLWHVGYKAASALDTGELGDTMSVAAFAYKKTTDKSDNRVLMASSYPADGKLYTKLLDAKLLDGSSSGSSGLTINKSCTRPIGMVADVALARDYTAAGEQALIAAYLADTDGRIHQYSPFYSSTTSVVKSLGCEHPLHFSPAVIQLNRNDSANINGAFIFLAQVTNSLLDVDTRTPGTPSQLVVLKLTSIGNSPPALDATFGTSGLIRLDTGCTGSNCLCGKLVGMKASTDTTDGGCGDGGYAIPATARPTGTPVAVLRTDGSGFQIYTTWYSPPADNWNNCADSDSNGTSYITLHEFLSNGTWAQLAGVAIQRQYVTGVQFVGTTLFVTYGMNEQRPGSPPDWPNLGQTFEALSKNRLQTMASDRFVRTAWAERLDL